MIKQRFNPLVALVSTLTLAAGSQTVYAQQTDADEIIITGFKASLQKAQELKRENTSIVEAVVAEDIGKLPDSSIAETLARLPGLAGERRNGRTSGLSVRGFKEDYVGTTLNGRELLGIGDNRGVEYDLYPSEIMSGAVIYKSPDASLSTTGIGGTVDLRTIRPLEAAPQKAISATYESNGLKSDNPDFDDTGHRFALSYSDKFADDTIGIALAAATTSSPSQIEQTNVWGYSTNQSGTGAYTPDGNDAFAISNVLDRDAITGIFQFKPNDQVDVTVDALHIKFAEKGIRRGFIEVLPFASATTTSDGIVTSGTSGGWSPVLRTDPTDIEGKLDSFGINASFAATDELTFKIDAAHSKTSKNDLRAESYSGVGRAGTIADDKLTTREWTLRDKGLFFTKSSSDFSDYNLVKLAGPQTWGGGMAPISKFSAANVHTKGAHGEDLDYNNAQDGFINEAVFEEKLDTLRLEATQKFDTFIAAVNVGLQYSKRSKEKENTGSFATAPTFPSDGPVPEKYRRGVADLNWTGLGNIVAYDGLALYKDGYYSLIDAAALEPDRMGDTYSIDEKVLTGFVKADFETNVSDHRVYGNAGIQIVESDQSSDGYKAQTGADLFVKPIPASGGDKYTKYLPSLNLNYEVAEDQTLRFAAAKSISRARFDYLKAGSSIKFRQNVDQVTNPDPAKGPWISNSGNPSLHPLEANQFDVTYDWYFADDGYVSVGYFYKDLVNWQSANRTVVDFSPYYIPGYHQAIDKGVVYTPATFNGIDISTRDGLKGSVKGLEGQANLPFRVIADALDGFGVIFSSSYTDGSLDDGSSVPGLSAHVSQLTAYYQLAGFEVRVAGTKRSKFQSEERGGSNTLSPITRLPTELWDAQISYDFADAGIDYLKGLRVSLQAQNLTDEDDVNSLATDSRLVTRVQHYGANYMLNLNYKF
ncbi:MAG TPA: TonB-dependent receptor [Cellvibrio sp.]